MKGILLLNGEPYEGGIDAEGAFVVCCDGAYKWAQGRVRIDENAGDFDSLDIVPVPPPEEVFPSEKDFTDGEIALYKLLDKGVDCVEIYGGGGGREDHFLGNLHLLYAAHERGVSAKMINNNSEILIASGKTEINNAAGKTVSVLPFGGKLHIMNSTGLKYPEPPQIGYGECIGISNVVLSDRAEINFAPSSVALIVINRRTV